MQEHIVLLWSVEPLAHSFVKRLANTNVNILFAVCLFLVMTRKCKDWHTSFLMVNCDPLRACRLACSRACPAACFVVPFHFGRSKSTLLSSCLSAVHCQHGAWVALVLLLRAMLPPLLGVTPRG